MDDDIYLIYRPYGLILIFLVKLKTVSNLWSMLE